MSALTINALRRWAKSGQSPLARLALTSWRTLREVEAPQLPVLHSALYALHRSVATCVSNVMRVMYWTPLFKSRLSHCGKALYLFGGMPAVLGALEIEVGDRCRIAGAMTLSGRTASKETPRLQIGNNCDVGWNSTIAVGRRVILGDNVRIAGRAFLAGYPGHPLDADARARGMAELDEQVGDIILEDDVWLATGVFVMSGVRIGKGTVVAAGSVVTRDLPPGVIAAGVPAKVIRKLANS